MGNAYLQYINMGISSDEEYLNQAEKAADKVFDLSYNSPHGYVLKGFIHFKRGDIQEGVRALKKALTLEPNNPDALMIISYLYGFSGKGFASKPLLDQLLKIDPLTPMNHCIAGLVEMLEGRYDQALSAFQTMYNLEPANPFLQYEYALGLALNEQYDAAFSIYDLISEGSPRTVFASLGLFFKYALQGRKTEAEALVTEDLINVAKWDEQYSWAMAAGYAMIGEKEAAFNWLENATRHRGWIPYQFLTEYDPFLTNIREEERFKMLMEEVREKWARFEV
jgi:tetratricopeptide (TPR) repeat protein